MIQPVMSQPSSAMKTIPTDDSSNRIFSVVGDRYRFLVTGEESGGAFAMFEFVIPPDHGPPPHVHHREDEVFHVIEGEFEFTIGGQSIRAAAGATLYGKRDVPHTFKNIGDQPGRMIVVVTPAGLEKFFAEVGTPLATHECPTVEPTPGDIQRLFATAPRYDLEILVPAPPKT
ncbi:MAG: cupin domain-containing protein [Terrimicrobiaceae bacterium]